MEHTGDGDREQPPAPLTDLDEQVTRLIQQKMAELLPTTSSNTRICRGRRQPEFDDESDWEDVSDDLDTSDDGSEMEVFVAPRKWKHKKHKADSSDEDAYTHACKKAPLVKKKKFKKSKKSKKNKSSSDSSSNSSMMNSKSDAPIANRMMAENKFSSLCDDMNAGITLLNASSNYLSYRKFENVYKSVCMDAGKEVARSKKVMDNDGKEYTLFLASKPIKGKPLDKSKMFGGQLQYLFKQVKTNSNCGKHMESEIPSGFS